MTNTQSHAKRELDILVANATDPNNRPIIEEFIPEILALCEKFGNSGQSGGSAPYTAKALSMAIEKLCLQKTICPIMGTPDEFYDVSEYSDGVKMYQNNRLSSIFKDGENGKPYYIEAIIKRTQSGSCWGGRFWLSKEDYLTGNRDLMVSNHCEIKSFPFEPKTFYIDVIEEEVAKDDWEMYLKDPKQLEDVYEYYNKYTPKVNTTKLSTTTDNTPQTNGCAEQSKEKIK